MSDENQETIADIVREMRTLGRLDEKSTGKIPRSLQALGLRTYADRIEAAWKREKSAIEATTEKSSAVGNAAKMREALEAVVKVGYPHNFQREAPHIRGYCYEITTAIEKCFAALAEPPRNCDMPEVAEGKPIDLAEQAWRVFKRSHKDSYLDAYGLLRCIGWLLTEAKGEVK